MLPFFILIFGGENVEAAYDVLTIAEQVEEEFLRLFDAFDVANSPDRKRADIIDSFWGDIYKKVFKPSPDQARLNNCNSKLKTYDVTEVQEVTEMYIKLCKRYGGIIKINQFTNLTGIHRATLWLWNNKNKSNGYIFNLDTSSISEEQNTIIYILNNNGVDIYYGGNTSNDNSVLSSQRFDVIKKLREEMQDANTNGLSNDTMGHAIRANNEEELGKLYEPKRMLQQETIRQSLSAAELPKLGQNKEIYVNQIEKKD